MKKICMIAMLLAVGTLALAAPPQDATFPL